LSESQICDIFSGRIKSWKEVAGGDGNIMVLTVVKRNDVFGGSVRKHMSCFKDLNISSEAVVLNRIQELQDAINQRPGTVGIISVTPEMNNTRLNIKAVAVGGVTPSTEALRSGKYKLFHEYGAVTLGEPQGTARRFLDFVAGPEGEKVMARGGMIAVRQP
jgi:phosphate transport system substrate-binding protein